MNVVGNITYDSTQITTTQTYINNIFAGLISTTDSVSILSMNVSLSLFTKG